MKRILHPHTLGAIAMIGLLVLVLVQKKKQCEAEGKPFIDMSMMNMGM